ncbi:MAG: Y-family DNA polymerase [Phycisphaerales bacterium]
MRHRRERDGRQAKLDRHRLFDPRPVLMNESRQGRELIAAACPRAMAAGVRIGMSLTHARALIRGAVVISPWKPERDAETLASLATWCNRFSPIVGIDPPDGLVLDVTGTHRLHRGEWRLLSLLRRSMERLGLRSRLAIASTAGCARAAARHRQSECAVIDAGEETAFLRAMPLEALHIARHQIEALREMGFDRIGSILDLPRSSLPARFGPDVLTALDAALGKRAEVISPVRPREAFHVERVFDGPTTHWQSVEQCVHMLVEQLVATLKARDMGVRRLDASLATTNRQTPTHITLTLCRPCRDAAHVWSMLRPHLERIDLGDGIEGVTLVAARTGLIKHSQRHMLATSGGEAVASSSDHDPHTARAMLCDTLANRLGGDAVMKVFHAEAHVPERTLRLATAMHEHPVRSVRLVNTTPRPSRLFLRPEPVQVMHMSPDGPIHRLHWRDSTWNVTACIGPERICSQWWLTAPDDACGDRDYYRVCIITQGHEPRWIWIYRLSSFGTWHVHGEWA